MRLERKSHLWKTESLTEAQQDHFAYCLFVFYLVKYYKMLINKKNIIFLSSVIFVLITLFVWSKSHVALTNRKPIAQNIPPTVSIPAHAIATGEGSYAMPTSISGQMKFVSPKLGISFLYVKSLIGNPGILAREEGNKVYIYADFHYSGFNYRHNGKSIEVLSKKPQDTLVDAIKQNILAGYSQNNCSVVSSISMIYKVPFSSNIETATVKPVIQNPTPVSIWEAANKCHAPYAQANDIRYFLMDKNHPTKYVFFNLGQDGIPSGQNDTEWEQTIQFLN